MKVAIVTGASSGLGREFVLQIAQKYSKLDEIWVIARRKDRLEALQKEVSIPLRVLEYDLNDKNCQMAFYELLDDIHPDVKILVNAAGYGIVGGFDESDYDSQIGMIDLNCKSLVSVTYRVLPYMAKKARIINFASAAAFMPQPYFAIYSATKSFVLSFSRALNMELKSRGISVTAVCPGPVKTEFFDIALANNKLPFYKKIMMAKPKKVVELAINDMTVGKDISVYGIKMKLFRLVAKIIPHSWLMKIGSKL